MQRWTAQVPSTEVSFPQLMMVHVPSLEITLCRRELSCPRLRLSLGTACIQWSMWRHYIDLNVGQHCRAILAPELLVECAEASVATALPCYELFQKGKLLSWSLSFLMSNMGTLIMISEGCY